MAEQNIDEKVDDKIDAKIEAAQIAPTERVPPGPGPVGDNLPARTTLEQDTRSAAQRLVNMTWETTQKQLAIFTVGIANIVAAVVVIRGIFFGMSDASLVMAAFTLISSSNFLIIGFYFGRTNHSRIGDEPRPQMKGGLDDR